MLSISENVGQIMVLLDTGFFIVVSLISFGLMFISFKWFASPAQAIFMLLAGILFMTQALYLVSDYEVGTVTTTTVTEAIDYEELKSDDTIAVLNSTSTKTTTSTEYLFNDFTEQTIVGMAYFVLGIISLGFSFVILLPTGART